MSVTGQQEHDPSTPNDVGARPGKSSRGLATFLSVLATPSLLFVVVLAAGGGHGTYWPAKTLFPWTMMSTSVTKSITQPFIVLGTAQYPLYGIILDWARAISRFKPAALTLLAAHFSAMLLAFAISNPSFKP
jgi:hypothetical protein